MKVFLKHVEYMANVSVGKPIYTPEVITRAFEYFATSRALWALYGKLTEDYQLLSIHTLTRITSIFSSQDDMQFLSNLLSKMKIGSEDVYL